MLLLMGSKYVGWKAICAIFGSPMFPPGECHHQGDCYRGKAEKCIYFNPDKMIVSGYRDLVLDEIENLGSVLSFPPLDPKDRIGPVDVDYCNVVSDMVRELPRSLRSAYPIFNTSACRGHRGVKGQVLDSLYMAIREEIDDHLFRIWLPLSRSSFLNNKRYAFEDRFAKLHKVRGLWVPPEADSYRISPVKTSTCTHEAQQFPGCTIASLARDPEDYILLGATVLGRHHRGNLRSARVKWCEMWIPLKFTANSAQKIQEMHMLGDILRKARLRFENDLRRMYLNRPLLEFRESSGGQGLIGPSTVSAQGSGQGAVTAPDHQLRTCTSTLRTGVVDTEKERQEVSTSGLDTHSQASTSRLDALYTDQGPSKSPSQQEHTISVLSYNLNKQKRTLPSSNAPAPTARIRSSSPSPSPNLNPPYSTPAPGSAPAPAPVTTTARTSTSTSTPRPLVLPLHVGSGAAVRMLEREGD